MVLRNCLRAYCCKRAKGSSERRIDERIGSCSCVMFCVCVCEWVVHVLERTWTWNLGVVCFLFSVLFFLFCGEDDMNLDRIYE